MNFCCLNIYRQIQNVKLITIGHFWIIMYFAACSGVYYNISRSCANISRNTLDKHNQTSPLWTGAVKQCGRLTGVKVKRSALRISHIIADYVCTNSSGRRPLVNLFHFRSRFFHQLFQSRSFFCIENITASLL